MSATKTPQTLVLIKPDALKLSLTGYVLSQLSELNTGLRIAGTRVVTVTRMLAEEHYEEHQGKPFYPPLLEYIMGNIHYADQPERRRVKAIVYQGENAVKKIRNLAGPTNPHDAREQQPGCIRSLGTVVPLKNDDGEVVGRRIDNLIHASATDVEAEREIKLWMRPSDIPPLCRIYAYKQSEEFFFYRDGDLVTKHEPGSVCFLTPGDYAWASDLEALDALTQGKTAHCSLKAVVAKYLANRDTHDY